MEPPIPTCQSWLQCGCQELGTAEQQIKVVVQQVELILLFAAQTACLHVNVVVSYLGMSKNGPFPNSPELAIWAEKTGAWASLIF